MLVGFVFWPLCSGMLPCEIVSFTQRIGEPLQELTESILMSFDSEAEGFSPPQIGIDLRSFSSHWKSL